MYNLRLTFSAKGYYLLSFKHQSMKAVILTEQTITESNLSLIFAVVAGKQRWHTCRFSCRRHLPLIHNDNLPILVENSSLTIKTQYSIHELITEVTESQEFHIGLWLSSQIQPIKLIDSCHTWSSQLPPTFPEFHVQRRSGKLGRSRKLTEIIEQSRSPRYCFIISF